MITKNTTRLEVTWVQEPPDHRAPTVAWTYTDPDGGVWRLEWSASDGHCMWLLFGPGDASSEVEYGVECGRAIAEAREHAARYIFRLMVHVHGLDKSAPNRPVETRRAVVIRLDLSHVAHAPAEQQSHSRARVWRWENWNLTDAPPHIPSGKVRSGPEIWTVNLNGIWTSSENYRMPGYSWPGLLQNLGEVTEILNDESGQER